MPSSDSDAPAFTEVDWDGTTAGRRRPSARTAGFEAALLGVVGLLAYDLAFAPAETIPMLDWDVNQSGWLVVVALVVLARYVLVPLVVDRDRTARHVRAFLGRPGGVLALGYLVVFGLLGLLGPELFDFPYAKLDARLQPPVFAGVKTSIVDGYSCIGKVTDGVCQGTWKYPLGTNYIGENVIEHLINGVHIAFKVGVATAVVMATVATTVGTVAGYYGGWIDDLLMRYVDIQQTIPAIVVYIVLATLVFGTVEGVSDGGMFVFVLVFGLLDWGGIARLVRAEALQRRNEGYVRAARAAGASDLHVIRRHVVPNSTATIVTALTRRIPLLVLAQVGLAYLALNTTQPPLFGELLLVSLEGRHMQWYVQWWTSIPAVLILVGLVVAFNVFGDTVRDVLDPREEVR